MKKNLQKIRLTFSCIFNNLFVFVEVINEIEFDDRITSKRSL